MKSVFWCKWKKNYIFKINWRKFHNAEKYLRKNKSGMFAYFNGFVDNIYFNLYN